MTTVPRGSSWRSQLSSAIEDAKAKLGPEAVDLSYRFDEDSTGEPSIFFRITLADWAAVRGTIGKVTDKISTMLFEEIQARENWGLNPYFNFESQSEQLARRDR